jgi:SET domain-containing protein
MQTKLSMRLQSLFISESSKGGRGVFTNEPIAANVTIEIAPVIVMDDRDRKMLDQTLLHDYIFEWGEANDQCAMALGWIPIFNHSTESNCEYFMDFEAEMMFVKTVRQISKNEELTVNYNGDFNNAKPVWFKANK